MPDWTRSLLVGVLVLLAIVHILKPDMAIDTTFLGLLAMAFLLAFFDPESIDLFGTWKQRKKKKELEEAQKQTEAIEVSPEEPPLPEAPEPSEVQAKEELANVEHKGPVDLWPPKAPAEALLWAAEQIKRELIVLMGNSGTEFSRKPLQSYHASELTSFLLEKRIIPQAFLEPILILTKRRNELAHGARITQDVVADSAHLACEILVKLRDVKRNYYRVRVGEIKLFEDSALSSPIAISGVMVVGLDHFGMLKSIKVFPREATYTTGRFVTWEWSARIVDDPVAYYQDPMSKQSALAWARGAAIFAGREYPEQWGLEYRLNDPWAGLLDRPPT